MTSPARPLRVAAVGLPPAVSGPGRQFLALAGALRAHEVTFRAYLLARDLERATFVPALEAAGVTHEVLADAHALAVGGLARRLAAAFAAFRPDIVQTHSYKASAVLTAMRLAGARTPWIGFFHGATAEDGKARLYHRLDRWLLRRADRVVVMSERARTELFGGAPHVHVIHNAVQPLAAPAVRRPRAPGEATIGVVGRLSHEKGVDLFLEALARLRARGVAVRAVVAGDGPDRARLAAQARALDLADRVAFLGQVEDVAAVYDAMDVLCIPSRSEGLPNVLLEAVARDLPVVSTAVGAVPEVVTSEHVALLVPPGDPAALADALARAVARPDDPAAHAARAALIRRLGVPARAEAHLRLYRDVLAAAAAGDAPSPGDSS